jgi:hypothetical protein
MINPTPAFPVFPINFSDSKPQVLMKDCVHYEEEQDMGAHIPYCNLTKNFCDSCDGCQNYKQKERHVPDFLLKGYMELYGGDENG